MTEAETSHVTIALDRDGLRLNVEALARDGVWACTRKANGAGFVITHVPTGRSVGRVYEALADALPVLAALGERFPRWERDATTGDRVRDAEIVLSVVGAL